MSNKEQDCGLSPTTGTVTRTVIGLNTPKSQLLRLGGKKKKKARSSSMLYKRHEYQAHVASPMNSIVHSKKTESQSYATLTECLPHVMNSALS